MGPSEGRLTTGLLPCLGTWFPYISGLENQMPVSIISAFVKPTQFYFLEAPKAQVSPNSTVKEKKGII